MNLAHEPNREEVSALCVLYGVPGADKQALVERVGATSDANAWLSNASDQMASLMVLEREARVITNVEVTLVPGLVQIFEYARLVLAASCRSGSDLERQVADRLGRQAVLSKPKAPQVSLVIDEGALHKTLGNPRMLREQLENLVVVQRRENVSIRVIPLEAEAHPALVGAFALYELVDRTSYVLMDGRSMGVFVSGSSDVAPFVEASRSLTEEELLALEGIGWDGELAQMRDDRHRLEGFETGDPARPRETIRQRLDSLGEPR